MSFTVSTHRISDKPGHDAVAVHVTGEQIVNVRLVFDGSDDRLGRATVNLGATCGMNRCGARGVMPLVSDDVTVEMTYADTGGPPDGDYFTTLHVHSETGGWL